MKPTTWLALALAFAIGGNASAAPTIETIFLEDTLLDGASSLPGFSPSDTVRFLGQRSLLVTPTGDFITPVRTDETQGSANGAAGVWYLFGSTDGGQTPTALRRESVIDGIDQQGFGSRAGIDNDGNVSYSVLTGNNGLAGSGESGLWENDTEVWNEDDEVPAGPLAGKFFGSAGSVYRSPDGVTSWSTSYSDTASGSSTGSALMRNTSTYETLLQSGDTVAGLGQIAAEGGAFSRFEWSIGGSNYIVEADFGVGFLSDDEAPVLNGNALFTNSGALIREGTAIPAADGGLPGEEWDIFDYLDVNEAGDYVITVFSNLSSAEDNFLFFNGEVLHREGETLDGVLLEGKVQSVGLNDRGDLAFTWSNTLFINGEKVFGPGSLVDTTGDGVGDTTFDSVAQGAFDIANQVAAGGDSLPVVYVGGRVGGKTAYVRLAPADALPGDFNGDGAVDALDYATWREGLGTEFQPSDLDLWRDNYGAGSLGAAGATATVPEPSGLLLVLASIACRLGRGRPAMA